MNERKRQAPASFWMFNSLASKYIIIITLFSVFKKTTGSALEFVAAIALTTLLPETPPCSVLAMLRVLSSNPEAVRSHQRRACVRTLANIQC